MAKLFETYNKFNEAKTSTKVRVFCRMCFANIWEPKSIRGSEPKYSVSCLFDKEDTNTIEMVKKAIEAARAEGVKNYGEKFTAGSNFKWPLRDGDIDRPEDGVYNNMMFVNSNSKDAPEIIDRKMRPVTDPMMVGSGDYAMITINFYPFNAQGTNKGIAAGLSNIQFAAHGERLSGKVSADKEFVEIPGDDDEALSGELPDFI